MYSDESGQASVADGGKTADGRALIALASASSPRDGLATRRQSAFLTQLLASKQNHPQARERRRAAPEEAIAAYRSTAALTR